MREALNNLSQNKVILEDKTEFYYDVYPYALTNALGNLIGTLQEYHFVKKDSSAFGFFKLYKTEEGNWYDLDELPAQAHSDIVWQLKVAVDAKEKSLSDSKIGL